MSEVTPGLSQDADSFRVFISYSRKDVEYTHRLADSLALRGYAPDFDQATDDAGNVERGISPEDEWWQRIQAMIAAADAMIFVVSPDSVASRVCEDEIAYARSLGKRIIAVLRRSVDFSAVPPRVAALNVKLDFTDDDATAFTLTLNQLCAALDTDVAWYRESRRLTALAARWDAAGRPEELLQSAADVRATGTLLEDRPRDAPGPPDLLLAMRDQSRERLDEVDKRQRRIVGRSFIRPAEQALDEGESDRALRLIAAGVVLAQDSDFELIPELWGLVPRAIFGSPLRASLSTGGSVYSAVWSPDGRRLLTASSTNVARIWAPDDARELVQLQADAPATRSAAWHPDGQQVITIHGASAIIWDVQAGRPIARLWGAGHQASIWSAAFSPDGKFVLTTEEYGWARIWNADTRQQVHELFAPPFEDVATGFYNPTTVLCGAFSPDGSVVATAGTDSTTWIWNVSTGKKVTSLKENDGDVVAVAFSPDGQSIATSSANGTVRIWSVDGASESHILMDHSRKYSWRNLPRYLFVDGVAWTPDGSRVATYSADSTVRIWDAKSGHEMISLRGHTRRVTTVAFSTDGRRLATGGVDGTVRIWDTSSTWEISRRVLHRGGVLSARISNDGRRFVTAGLDKTAVIADCDNGHVIARLEDHEDIVRKAVFSPDGRRVATGCDDAIGRIWDSVSGQLISKLIGHGGSIHGNGIHDLSFSPDGARIATGSHDQTARIWDVAGARELYRLHPPKRGHGHDPHVNAVAWSPDGTKLATGTHDQVVWIWDIESQEMITRMEGHEWGMQSVSFRSDGQCLLTASEDKTIRVWDTNSGSQTMCLVHEITGVSAFPRLVGDWSPDGRYIIAGSEDNCAWILDAAYGVEVACLAGHSKPVTSAIFFPDQSRIMTASLDGSVRIWDSTRLAAFSGNRTVLLAAGLARGIGRLLDEEKRDLLLSDAPSDLFDAVVKMIPQLRAEVDKAVDVLNAAVHENCYVGISEFEAMFETSPLLAEVQSTGDRLSAGIGETARSTWYQQET